jgi:hypothetical protein
MVVKAMDRMVVVVGAENGDRGVAAVEHILQHHHLGGVVLATCMPAR